MKFFHIPNGVDSKDPWVNIKLWYLEVFGYTISLSVSWRRGA